MWQKQVSIELFLVKVEKSSSSDLQVEASAKKHPKKVTENVNEGQTSEPQPGPSGVQIPRKENGNEGTVPTVHLEDDNGSESSSPPM